MSERINTPNIEAKDFLFISYKHDDIEVVDAIISRLYEKGVRIWYDANLHIGESWTEIAEEKIMHPNCRGIILFNSAAAFKSHPVHLERSWTMERLKKDTKGENFGYFSVNINNDSYLYLLKRTFDSLPNDPHLVDKEFSMTQIATILGLFDDRVIYANPCDPDGCAQSLFNAIKAKFPAVIDMDYVNMQKLQTQGLGTEMSLVFGLYKQIQAAVEIPS